MVTQIYNADSPFQPKGDHNRRIALGLDIDQMAAFVGINGEQLHAYEATAPDHEYDAAIAARVALALDQLEAGNTPVPLHTHDEAAAMRDGIKPGPQEAPVQVRDAGPEAQADQPEQWDETDEAVDETFPASDAVARY